MSSALLQLEVEAKDRLESFAFFDALTILVAPRKNIVAEIKAQIGKLKTLIVPKIVGADDNHPNIHGVYFDEIRLTVGIFQQPTLAAAHPPTLEIAEEVHKAFKNWTPDSLSNAFNPIRPGIEEIADKTLNIHSCSFATKGGFVGAITPCETPVITPGDGGQVSLACATAGAAIFYTLDGTRPRPISGTFYTAPVVLALGQTIKAAAFLAGYFNSKIATYTRPSA